MTDSQDAGGSSGRPTRTSFRREEEAVLEAVLESTSHASVGSLRSETMTALKDIARRRRGEHHCSNEAFAELISVFVKDAVDGLPARFSEAWTRRLTEQIVAAIADDQFAAERIAAFWSRLQQTVA